jgi:hypothetical protein
VCCTSLECLVITSARITGYILISLGGYICEVDISVLQNGRSSYGLSAILTSFIPEFSENQIHDLERVVFNSIISTFEDDKMDSVWNGAFETLYRRKAAELTASLTTDEGYGNGNKTLLTRF